MHIVGARVGHVLPVGVTPNADAELEEGHHHCHASFCLKSQTATAALAVHAVLVIVSCLTRAVASCSLKRTLVALHTFLRYRNATAFRQAPVHSVSLSSAASMDSHCVHFTTASACAELKAEPGWLIQEQKSASLPDKNWCQRSAFKVKQALCEGSGRGLHAAFI